MLEEYDIDKLNPRPNPYAKELKMEGMASMKSAYKQWQENYVQEAVNNAVNKAVSEAIHDTTVNLTNDFMDRITNNLMKQHPDWTRDEAREHAKALISVM